MDDTDTAIIYSDGHWVTNGWTVNGTLYNGSRHYNYVEGVAVKASDMAANKNLDRFFTLDAFEVFGK